MTAAIAVSRRHADLVVACVASDDEFPGALEHGLREVDFDVYDPIDAELFPLLYRRAEDLDVDHPARGRLRSYYLRTWRANQILLHRARPVFERLIDHGEPFVVLKGGAIVSSRYRNDLGVRPMGDLDLLMSRPAARSIIDWMLQNGWHVDDTLGWTARQYLRAHHAVSMHLGDDGSIDLHVGLLSTDRSPDLDAELVRSAVPASLGGVPVRVLDTTSQIMHTLSHSNPNGVRHLVDALHLISAHGDEIEWGVVCDQVIERRSVARTLTTVEGLLALDPDAVPSDVVARLRDSPKHWTDWSYHQHAMASLEGPRIFATRLAQRSRGETVRGRLFIAGLLVRHYVHAAVTGRGEERRRDD